MIVPHSLFFICPPDSPELYFGGLDRSGVPYSTVSVGSGVSTGVGTDMVFLSEGNLKQRRLWLVLQSTDCGEHRALVRESIPLAVYDENGNIYHYSTLPDRRFWRSQTCDGRDDVGRQTHTVACVGHGGGTVDILRV